MWGSDQKKKLFPRKLRKTITVSVVAFFSILGPLLLWAPERALRGYLLLACCCCCCCCLLDAFPNTLVNRLKYYVFQLGDPNPSPYDAVGVGLRGSRAFTLTLIKTVY